MAIFHGVDAFTLYDAKMYSKSIYKHSIKQCPATKLAVVWNTMLSGTKGDGGQILSDCVFTRRATSQ